VRRVGTFAATLAAFALASGFASTRAVAASTCDLADITAAAGRLDVAHQLYAELLKSKKPLPCAAVGLAQVAENQAAAQRLVAVATTAEELGHHDEALAKATEAVQVDPSSPDAASLVQSLGGVNTDPYAAAQRLLAADYGDEARAEARKAAIGSAVPIPRSLKARRDQSWKKRFDDWLGWLTSAAPFLSILGIILLIAVRHVRRPQVHVIAFPNPSDEVSMGAGLTDMLLDEMQSNGTGRNLERVIDDVAEPYLDLTASLGDRWKWLSPVLRSLGPRQVITVKGDAFILHVGDDSHPAEAGFTLNIISGRRVVATKTFIDSAPGKTAADILSFRIPLAAAWVITTLAQLTRAARQRPMLGTSDWHSWGRFRQGVWHHNHKEDAQARTSYLRAIEADYRNVGAWLNLAALDVREPTGWSTAIERLEVVASLLPVDRRSTDPNWYRTLNLRAVTLLHRATHCSGQPSQAQRADRDEALKSALALVKGLALASSQLDLHPSERRGEFARLSTAEADDLRYLVSDTEGIAITLLASVLVEPNQRPSLCLAPNYTAARARELLVDLGGEDVTVDNVLCLLAGLFRSDRLADGITEAFAVLPGPAHYNLACVYARAYAVAADAAEKKAYYGAMEQGLRRGLEARPELAVWARDSDPAFECLRAAGSGASIRDKFMMLVNSLVLKETSVSGTDEWILTLVS
jgi:tetratricopeptide (TPR) repeat protein